MGEEASVVQEVVEEVAIHGQLHLMNIISIIMNADKQGLIPTLIQIQAVLVVQMDLQGIQVMPMLHAEEMELKVCMSLLSNIQLKDL